ncbi:MAG: alpha/beta fold hydrolase [Bacteroidales bacterium]|nr:alpha/beta fold hydrolase [Bacteroidales bacterium]
MNRFNAICVTLLAAVTATGAEREVRVHNGDVVLAGTLALPDNVAPTAVVVLATGSGAQDRDESLAGHAPFRILSDSLAAAGFAVLRMDDRGTASSTGDYASARLSDFDSDIEAGLAFVDSCLHGVKKGVIGHSQGGQTAIKLAARGKCDFIVTLAVPAWRGDSIIMSQSRAMATAITGRWDAEPLQRRLMDIAGSNQPDYMAHTMIYMALAESVGEMSRMPAVRERLEASTNALLSPAYRDMLRYDPADNIKAVDVPWLALNGDKDTQVLPQNLLTIKQLNPSAETVVLPGHNHLFQICTTGLVTEYESLAQSPSSETLTTIISWLGKL